MAPADPRRVASQLRNIGLAGKSHWYMRQKTLEAILHLPYKEESAERLVEAALDHHNPWVRRAGGALVARGRVTWIQEIHWQRFNLSSGSGACANRPLLAAPPGRRHH